MVIKESDIVSEFVKRLLSFLSGKYATKEAVNTVSKKVETLGMTLFRDENGIYIEEGKDGKK